jgi:plasmid stabilization system protein ParE
VDADLDGIISYIVVDLANPKAASDFVDKLQMTIEEIQSFPESGVQVVNEYLPNSDVRKKIIDNYILYYLPDYKAKINFILRIVYGGQNTDEVIMHLET